VWNLNDSKEKPTHNNRIIVKSYQREIGGLLAQLEVYPSSRGNYLTVLNEILDCFLSISRHEDKTSFNLICI
jgi:hypothetical protein